ncbi:MAG: Uma2 family endonuclease [Granulosicoccus sp.]
MNAVMNEPTRHSLSVDDYYRMAEVGILAPDARVELIEGEIIDRVPIGCTHASVVDYLNRMLVLAVGDSAIVRTQNPVRLDNYSEPEPDFAILKPRQDSYRKSHPTADDVFLLIEVSDSTLRYDRNIKMPLYAKFGVPAVWIIDVAAQRLHIYNELQQGKYLAESLIEDFQDTSLPLLEDVSLILKELFV